MITEFKLYEYFQITNYLNNKYTNRYTFSHGDNGIVTVTKVKSLNLNLSYKKRHIDIGRLFVNILKGTIDVYVFYKDNKIKIDTINGTTQDYIDNAVDMIIDLNKHPKKFAHLFAAIDHDLMESLLAISQKNLLEEARIEVAQYLEDIGVKCFYILSLGVINQLSFRIESDEYSVGKDKYMMELVDKLRLQFPYYKIDYEYRQVYDPKDDDHIWKPIIDVGLGEHYLAGYDHDLLENKLMKLELKDVYNDALDIFKSNFFKYDYIDSWQVATDIGKFDNTYMYIYFQNTIDLKKFDGSITKKKLKEICNEAMGELKEEHPHIFDYKKSGFYIDYMMGHEGGEENEMYYEVTIQLIPYPHIKDAEVHDLL